MAQGSAAARAAAKTVGPWRKLEQQAAELGWSDIAAQRQALQAHEKKEMRSQQATECAESRQPGAPFLPVRQR